MTKLDMLLDGVHSFSSHVVRATRRKRHVDRQQVLAVVSVASALVKMVAGVFPQAQPAALLVSGLEQAAPKLLPENPLFGRLRAVNEEIEHTTGEQKLRFEAQRDILLSLIEEQEHNR